MGKKKNKMNTQKAPIIKKYHSKDLNIAYNDGIEEGKSQIAEQLFKERAEWQKKVRETKAQAISDLKENMLMTKTNHQLGCMLECYQSVIENRIGFEKEAKQLLEIASKLK